MQIEEKKTGDHYLKLVTIDKRLPSQVEKIKQLLQHNVKHDNDNYRLSLLKIVHVCLFLGFS